MSDHGRPVFIGGLQRSGTSLMRAIVGSHPALAVFQWDLPLWTRFYDRYRNQDLNDRTVRDKLLDQILAHKKAQLADVRLDRPAILDSLANTRTTFTCGVIFEHVLSQYARQLGRPRWGLKTPGNEFYADAIFEAYPGARMIHMIRDPRDVAVSMKSLGWFPDVVTHSELWRDSARLACQNLRKYSEAYTVVRYEELVGDPQGITRDVCRTAGLEWHPDLLLMDGHPGWSGANSKFVSACNRDKRIYRSGVGRYRRHLSPAEARWYEWKLRAEMSHWRYDSETS